MHRDALDVAQHALRRASEHWISRPDPDSALPTVFCRAATTWTVFGPAARTATGEALAALAVLRLTTTARAVLILGPLGERDGDVSVPDVRKSPHPPRLGMPPPASSQPLCRVADPHNCGYGKSHRLRIVAGAHTAASPPR